MVHTTLHIRQLLMGLCRILSRRRGRKNGNELALLLAHKNAPIRASKPINQQTNKKISCSINNMNSDDITDRNRAFRWEHDLIGDEQVPQDVYYGIQTLRAVQNFDITGVPISHFPLLIKSLAMVKKAACLANLDLGHLDPHKADAIVAACDEIILDGQLHDQFPVDLIQGGAGTSTNMNANEVIANRGLEIMGHCKGEYHFLHPNNDVNMSQSTNDVYPTAARLAIVFSDDPLQEAVDLLRRALDQKADEFAHILKLGRTQLQDAVPMTLGQEFHGWSVTLGEDMERMHELASLFAEINLGGTAIGTGINAVSTLTMKL